MIKKQSKMVVFKIFKSYESSGMTWDDFSIGIESFGDILTYLNVRSTFVDL